ncbi:L-seryl-tRNA(Sec) selenium transferase [bacterium]|nr:L-seryl-tRNA(Sec) selenium transferase [bacterium]
MNYRIIPSINEVLEHTVFKFLIHQFGRTIIRNTLREILVSLRTNIGHLKPDQLQSQNLANQVFSKIRKDTRCNIRRIINATGTVLHTNLGRAPIPREAIYASVETAEGYCNLEFNLETGKRGKRTDHISKTLCILTGAEAAIAVNNNAGAVLLTLAALARGKEVIISRGELIEIGGGFRIPEVMEASGALLREIGTTNRTHPADYTNAINENTGFIMKAHTSNFGIVGFTSEVSPKELATIGKSQGIPVMYDLGSGNFVRGEPYGWSSPLVIDQIKAGVDIVTFSGDKLLGGPQAGIIAGKKKYVDTIARHPLARALRLDKMTLSALDATLKLYLQPEKLIKNIPTLSLLCVHESVLKQRALKICRYLKNKLPDSFSVDIQKAESTPGGGCMPLISLNTWTVNIRSTKFSAATISAQLRRAALPVIARIQKDIVILDVRTIPENEVGDLIKSVVSVLVSTV